MSLFRNYTAEARRNILGSETPLAIADFFCGLDLETGGGRTVQRYRFYYGERYANPASFYIDGQLSTPEEGYIVVTHFGHSSHPSCRFCAESRKGGVIQGIVMSKIVLIEYAKAQPAGTTRVIYRHPHLATTWRSRGKLRMADELMALETPSQLPVNSQLPKRHKRRIHIRGEKETEDS